jgi:DNA-binding CsgD family transcriptional regulator
LAGVDPTSCLKAKSVRSLLPLVLAGNPEEGAWFLFWPPFDRLRIGLLKGGGPGLRSVNATPPQATFPETSGSRANFNWTDACNAVATRHFGLPSAKLTVPVWLQGRLVGLWSASAHSEMELHLVATRTAQIAEAEVLRLENKALRLISTHAHKRIWIVDVQGELFAHTLSGRIFYDATCRSGRIPAMLLPAIREGKSSVRLTGVATGTIERIASDEWGIAPPLFAVEIMVEPTTDGGIDLSRLTRAEIAVCNLVCEGLTNSEIAGRLGKAELTVQNQVHSILTKTGAKDRRELMLRKGAVHEPAPLKLAPDLLSLEPPMVLPKSVDAVPFYTPHPKAS